MRQGTSTGAQAPNITILKGMQDKHSEPFSWPSSSGDWPSSVLKVRGLKMGQGRAGFYGFHNGPKAFSFQISKKQQL